MSVSGNSGTFFFFFASLTNDHVTVPLCSSVVVSKRKKELVGPEAKRSRSQSPCVAADFKLPPFNPSSPLGETHTHTHRILCIQIYIRSFLRTVRLKCFVTFLHTLIYIVCMFLFRSRVCGAKVGLLLQPLLCFLPEREHRQGHPLQQPEALRQPAGTDKHKLRATKCFSCS